MILVVGGAYQGKLKFAERLLNTSEERDTVTFADGASDPPEAAFESRIINHFHEYIRRLFIDDTVSRDILSENTKDSGMADAKTVTGREESTEKVYGFCDMILRRNPDVIIVSDLIGGGIVPIEAKDRRWRDLSGEACEYLARNASKVYRVICGIPQILKGGEE